MPYHPDFSPKICRILSLPIYLRSSKIVPEEYSKGGQSNQYVVSLGLWRHCVYLKDRKIYEFLYIPIIQSLHDELID